MNNSAWEKQLKDLNTDVQKLQELIQNRRKLNQRLQLILEAPTQGSDNATINEIKIATDTMLRKETL